MSLMPSEADQDSLMNAEGNRAAYAALLSLSQEDQTRANTMIEGLKLSGSQLEKMWEAAKAAEGKPSENFMAALRNKDALAVLNKRGSEITHALAVTKDPEMPEYTGVAGEIMGQLVIGSGHQASAANQVKKMRMQPEKLVALYEQAVETTSDHWLGLEDIIAAEYESFKQEKAKISKILENANSSFAEKAADRGAGKLVRS